MSYNIYGKDVENGSYNLIFKVNSFYKAIEAEKKLKKIGLIHVLAVGVKDEHQ